MEGDVTYCNGCRSMTHSIQKEKLVFICEKCGYDKTYGDILQNKLNRKKEKKCTGKSYH